MIPGLLPIFLHGCEIKVWEGPGDEASFIAKVSFPALPVHEIQQKGTCMSSLGKKSIAATLGHEQKLKSLEKNDFIVMR